MSEPSVVPATASDRQRVVETVTAAFVADPAFRFFFPDDATYPDLVARFTGFLFDKRLVSDTAWVVAGGAAAALWDPPVTAKAGEPPAGQGPAPALDLPEDVRLRLATWDAAVHHLLPDEPHWYLGMLATDPAHAGQGWGRATMAEGLARAAHDRLPAYLETATDVNVELYRRAGWTVVASVPVGSVTARVMRHPGGAA